MSRLEKIFPVDECFFPEKDFLFYFDLDSIPHSSGHSQTVKNPQFNFNFESFCHPSAGFGGRQVFQIFTMNFCNSAHRHRG